MDSLLNTSRPPVFCPGCTHEKITRNLDNALVKLGIPADKTVIVSDIGCSGLFDTFFNVHALHGLHGRALTYATGLKLADPELNVIVTMGDGGLGIGGAHVLAACRKNLDMTLLILNNFNFGMTGGQFSVTTPTDAIAGSSFLNQAEVPVDICEVAKSAGATWIKRCSGNSAELPDVLVDAMNHKGFSVVETLGMCTGRYTKNNRLTPKLMDEMIETQPTMNGLVESNERPEYGEQYREIAKEKSKTPKMVVIEKQFEPPQKSRQEIVILGSAGMRIVTAGDILCYSGMSAGMNATMKNDYNITVLRGQSVSELILSPEPIGYAGIYSPNVLIALSEEGVQRRIKLFNHLTEDTFVLAEKNVNLPDTRATVTRIDFKDYKVTRNDWALASLGLIAKQNKYISLEMLFFAVKQRFKPAVREKAVEILNKVIR